MGKSLYRGLHFQTRTRTLYFWCSGWQTHNSWKQLTRSGGWKAIPKKREIKKKEIHSFIFQRHTLSSFDFVVTYWVTNFLPKLVDMLFFIFSTEKTEFPFFEFLYFRVLPCWYSSTSGKVLPSLRRVWASTSHQLITLYWLCIMTPSSLKVNQTTSPCEEQYFPIIIFPDSHPRAVSYSRLSSKTNFLWVLHVSSRCFFLRIVQNVVMMSTCIVKQFLGQSWNSLCLDPSKKFFFVF